MPKQESMRVLTVRESCLSFPQTCSEVYTRQSALSAETPFCVATFPVVLGSNVGDTGALAGVLTAHVLPEAGASLYIAVIGTCHSLGKDFDPLLPYYYSEGFARDGVEFSHEQQLEQEESRFTWQCFCFRGDILPLASLHPSLESVISSAQSSHEGKRVMLYSFTRTLNTLEAIHNICLKPVSRLVFHDNTLTLHLSITLMNNRIEKLQLVPLPVLISQYRSWIIRTLVPSSLCPKHHSRSSSSSYISITSDDSTMSSDLEADLADLIISRFSPINTLCRQTNHYGNEIFVTFAPSNLTSDRVDFLRNVCVFPGQGLSYDDSGIGVTVGSFYVYERFPHSIGAVRLGFEHYESSTNGTFTYIGLAKTTPPHTDLEPPIELGLAVVCVYVAPDSTPAVQASSSNYRHMRYYNIRDPFTYMSSAFHMPFLLRSRNIDIEPELLRASKRELFLELHRPLYGAHSGGTFFLFKLNRTAKVVSIIIPEFTGKLQPPSKTYPRYKSQLTYYPICVSGIATGYSALSFLKGDVAVGSIDTSSSVGVDLIKFSLECVESVTYKQRDRLVFPVILYRMLPRALGVYYLDLGATCISRTSEAPDTQMYPDCAIACITSPRLLSQQDACRCYRRAGTTGCYSEQLDLPRPHAYLAQIGAKEIQWRGDSNNLPLNTVDPSSYILEEYFCIRPSLFPYIPTSPNYYVLIVADLLLNIQAVEPDDQRQANLKLFLETYLSKIAPENEFAKAKISADARQHLLALHEFTLHEDGSMAVYRKT